MGNKYQESIGKWEHKLGKITHTIEPEEDDNYAFLKAKSDTEKSGDSSLLFKSVGELYFKMVLRSEPSMDEENQKWLKKWIGLNISKIVEDFLIAFRWTTPEKLNELKKNIK
ncbi:hypothetical protein LCGC14_1083290 [marine sediment metagenome]|uniref:Uncharacterized protein n=1 Tax=marine sediment metagenome TaxID=412755 RepID=A0A0F9MJ59_9ZZZZ